MARRRLLLFHIWKRQKLSFPVRNAKRTPSRASAFILHLKHAAWIVKREGRNAEREGRNPIDQIPDLERQGPKPIDQIPDLEHEGPKPIDQISYLVFET